MISRKLIVPAAFFLAAILPALPGCVERKITIGSDPNGALVHLNDIEIGHTPVTVPFTWYGDYDIVLTADKNVGTAEHPVYKHYYLHTHKRAHAPVFQWIGIDLFAELLPIRFKDEKVWAFTVPPIAEPSNDDLLRHAEELKARLNEKNDLQPATKPAQ